jgi:hypothetical protein
MDRRLPEVIMGYGPVSRARPLTPDEVATLTAYWGQLHLAELTSSIVTKSLEPVRYEMLDPVTGQWVPAVPPAEPEADTPHVVGG